MKRAALVLALAGLSMLGMGTRIFRGSGGAGATFTAAFTAVPLQGATCVAPCAVHFDGSTSDSTSYTREFHELTYRWGFGDTAADSLSWWHTAETGISRNEDFGPIVGHVYEAAGTYTATLDVTAPDGTTASTTRSVVVADPQTVFGDAGTWCFSTTTSFTGCPLDDDSDGICEAGESSYTGHCVVVTGLGVDDFDRALTVTANADADKVRALFRGGSTFTSNATVPLGPTYPTARTAAPGLISSFGTGRATVNVTSAIAAFTLKDGWQVANLNVHGTSSEVSLNEREWVTSLGHALPTNNAGFYNVTLDGPIYDCNGFGTGGAGFNEDVWFASVVCDKTATSSGVQFTLGEFSRSILIGSDLFPNYTDQTQYTARYEPRNTAISHNRMNAPGISAETPPGYRGPFQIRASPTVPVSRNEIAYNKFETKNGPSGGTEWTKICNHVGGCGPFSPARPGEGGDCSDIIYENNFHSVDGGTALVNISNGIQIVCDNVTVRNNVFDFQGNGALTGAPTVVNATISEPDLPLDGYVQAYGNTAYLTGESTTMLLCGNSSGVSTGMRCSSNLVYSPSGGTITESTGTWSGGLTGNDRRTSPVPSWWPGTPPAATLTDFLDFLATSGTTCDLTAASLTNAGAQRGCIVH